MNTPGYLDPAFVFHKSQTHDDASVFRKRMKAYAKAVKESAAVVEANKAEASNKVRTLKTRAA